MPTSRRFRTTPTRHSRAHFSLAESGIDRDNLRLQNVVGMETGLALGHNVIADETTLHLVAGLANARNEHATDFASSREGKRTGTEVTKKVRQRFGHPAMSSDGTGRTIGTLSNFSVANGKLLHDTQFYNAARLSPAFSGDVVEYIFTLAEEAPESLNESAVVEASLIWQLESGDEVELTDAEYDQAEWGQATPPEDSVTEFPILRPFSIGHIDLVSDGALTDSLFATQSDAERFFSSAFSGHGSIFGAELFDLIDRFRDQFGLTLSEIETKGIEIITKYVYVRRSHTQASEGESIMAKRNSARPNVSQLAYEQADGAVETIEGTTETAIVSEEVTTVSEVEEVEPQGTIEDSSEPVSATVEDDEANVDDELGQIGDILAETEADEADAEPIESVEALAAVQTRVSELSDVVSRQGERIEKITAFLLQQANQLQAISRNLRRLDGERIVTERVPMSNRHAEDGLEQAPPPTQDFVPPLHGYVETPGAVGMRQFSSVIDGNPPDLVLASDTPNAVAEKAAERRVKRNEQYRLGTRK